MRSKSTLLIFLSLSLILAMGHTGSALWGFFGHRLINRMAIFTLPEAMLPLFKTEIEYITEHAVDPDKRRYAAKHEGVRHYIDIDHWGVYPFKEVPRDFTDALIKYTDILLILDGDTTFFRPDWDGSSDIISFVVEGTSPGKKRLSCSFKSYRSFFVQELMPQYYQDEWSTSTHIITKLFEWSPTPGTKVLYQDRFSGYGILPYHLMDMYYGLVSDFKRGEKKRLLRRISDLGHYVADAHVPLHTTENYNGQLTNQIGIHAFWESRLPELFAMDQYDFFVGSAEYIKDKRSYFWDIILDSHLLLDRVLESELRTRKKMPQDLILCFEDRLGRNVEVPCRAFSEAYHNALDGMVEERLTAAVKSLGDVWYSAWVDAGKPDLTQMSKQKIRWTEQELQAQRELDKKVKSGAVKGRSHEH